MRLNDYVKEAYEIFGKPFGYQTGAFLETQAQEKREALEAATGFELNTLGRRLGTAVGSHHGKSGDTALMDRYRGNHPQPAPAAPHRRQKICPQSNRNLHKKIRRSCKKVSFFDDFFYLFFT